jgi:hypothetical protein
MMKFEKTAEFGSHTVFGSINHADPARSAEIVEDHDLGGFVAQIVKPELEGEDSMFETVGEFETFEQAKRELECLVTFTIKA